MKFFILGALTFAMLAFLPGFSCKQASVIDGVAFKIDPNVQTAKVQLNFSSEVESDLGGTFDVKSGDRDYGTLEVEPSTSESPFNVGFRLNLEIVNDPAFNKLVQLNPVLDLPSGQPIPIPNLNRAFAQVKMVNEINPNFDIYAYIDAANNGREWVGVAMTLKFLNNKYFPAGLSVSKQFLKDSAGRARAVGAVFGPKVDNNGNLVKAGGIALFANLKALIAGGKLEGGDKGSKLYIFDGPLAPYYEQNPKAAFQLNQAFKTLMRANSHGQQMM